MLVCEPGFKFASRIDDEQIADACVTARMRAVNCL